MLITVGTAPAVVTETLYALHVRDAERGLRHPRTAIQMLTTEEGHKHVQEKLLEGTVIANLVEEYCMDYLDPITPKCVIVFPARGRAVADIQSTSDALAMSDEICAVVREWSQQQDFSIHASIAGGRKPMSMQLGFALSMLGRPGDELSHVLTIPERPDERCEHPFYFPSRRNAGSTEIDVRLVEVPILLLGSRSIPRLGDTRDSYSALVNSMQALFAPEIEINIEEGTIDMPGRTVKLGPRFLAPFAWCYLQHVKGRAVEVPPSKGAVRKSLVARDGEGLSAIDRDGDFNVLARFGPAIEAGRQIQEIYDQLPRSRGRFDRLYPFPKLKHTPELANVACFTSELFSEAKSRVHREICDALGHEQFAEPYYVNPRTAGSKAYSPGIPPERIRFRWSDEERGEALM